MNYDRGAAYSCKNDSVYAIVHNTKSFALSRNAYLGCNVYDALFTFRTLLGASMLRLQWRRAFLTVQN